MQPIINPWVIYIIEVMDSIQTILSVIGSGLLLYLIVIAIFQFVICEECDDAAGMIKGILRQKKIVLNTSIAFCIIATLMPSRATLYTMLILDNITVNNITATGETLDKSIDNIISKIDKLLNQGE